VVWILDPIAWNRHALRHQGFDRGILTPVDEALQSYKPLTRFSDMNVQPVAIYGAYNSPRIVAQRGAFTIFGQNTLGMDRTFDEERFPKECLVRVVFERLLRNARGTEGTKVFNLPETFRDCFKASGLWLADAPV
jgi:hypothetical protein